MPEQLTTIAQRCLDAAFAGTMNFPAIARMLMDAGIEGYDVDYRRGTCTYFHASGESVQLTESRMAGAVASTFDATGVEQAVRDAQRGVPGYSYAGFNATVQAAGCAGYMVSFSGKRVVYFGRTAETHVEHFPQ